MADFAVPRARESSICKGTQSFNAALLCRTHLKLCTARIGGDLAWLQPEDDSEVSDYVIYLAEESTEILSV